MKIELHKKYRLENIIDFCNRNDLITVDCLKEENMISVEKYNDGNLGDCIIEFKRIGNDLFRLSWIDKINLQNSLIKNISQNFDFPAKTV